MGLFCYELMVQPINDKNLLPERMKKQFEFREIKQDDPCLSVMPRPPEIIEFRFKQDAICLGLFKNDKLIGYIWFCFGKYVEDEVRCIYILKPEKASVFDFDLYIFPEHRLGLGFSVIWDEANKFLRTQGIHQTFSRLTLSNIASKRAHNHFGWKLCCRALCLKAWDTQIMLTSVSPYIGFSRRKTDYFTIKLNADVLNTSDYS